MDPFTLLSGGAGGLSLAAPSTALAGATQNVSVGAGSLTAKGVTGHSLITIVAVGAAVGALAVLILGR